MAMELPRTTIPAAVWLLQTDEAAQGQGSQRLRFVLESPELIHAKVEIKRLNEELQPDIERTPNLTLILRYGVAVLSVAAAVIIAGYLDRHLMRAFSILLLCALMFIAWYGRVKRSLRAMALSLLAFKYYFVITIHSLTLGTRQTPRLLIFLLALVSPGIMAQTGVETPRTIRVVMDNAYAPYSFQSDDGKLQGILVDQWQAWEKKTGIKVEVHEMDWEEALRRMRAGEFDVIDSIVETAERRDYFDFTPAYTTIEASIFFRNDISGISDLASLRGFPVGVKAGDQHIDQLRANGVTTVIVFQNNDAIIEAAKQHKINVFLIDNPSALYLLNKMGMEAEFRHSAPIFRDELRRAVRKGDAALLRTVSEGFAAIEPGELTQIDEKWFGRTINKYGRYLTYAGYAALVAILLIAGLVGWNRMLRRRILQRTAALGESEERFRQIAGKYRDIFENAGEGIFQSTPDGRYIAANPALARMYRFASPEELIHSRQDISRQVYVDQTRREEFRNQLETQGAVRGFEHEVFRKDGSRLWISVNARAVLDEQGAIQYYEGTAQDINERKAAEEKIKATSEQLRALSARLQSAREEEGTRIAREIHDELGSALTSLRWDLEGIENVFSESENGSQLTALQKKIAAMLGLTDTTINVVRRIASELRPTILDDLGPVAAIRWQAQQFEAQAGIVCQCDFPEEEVDLDQQQSTTIFRVFQEALTNVRRHALATRVEVTLEKANDELVLTISDNGRGITAAEKSDRQSLGLLGMRERVNLIGGTIQITGVEEKGTVITVRVPIPEDLDTASADHNRPSDTKY